MGKSQLTQELGNCSLQKLKVIIWSSSREGYRVKLIYSGHPLQRTDSLEKNLILGKIEGGRRRGWHKFEQTQGISDGQGGLECCSPLGHKESDTIE